MPVKMAASGGLNWHLIDLDEPTYKSVTNEDLEIIGQTSAFVKLEKFKTPVKLNFLVCLDEGEEALLSLDTLKDLTIVPSNFPCPMDKTKLEARTRRVRKEEEEWWPQGETEDEEEEGNKQRKSWQLEITLGDEGDE